MEKCFVLFIHHFEKFLSVHIDEENPILLVERSGRQKESNRNRRRQVPHHWPAWWNANSSMHGKKNVGIKKTCVSNNVFTPPMGWKTNHRTDWLTGVISKKQNDDQQRNKTSVTSSEFITRARMPFAGENCTIARYQTVWERENENTHTHTHIERRKINFQSQRVHKINLYQQLTRLHVCFFQKDQKTGLGKFFQRRRWSRLYLPSWSSLRRYSFRSRGLRERWRCLLRDDSRGEPERLRWRPLERSIRARKQPTEIRAYRCP